MPVAQESESDRAILGRFVAGQDEEAFAALVARHASLVMGVSRRILGNAADAEDAFQATFIVLSKKASSIRNLDSVSSWLHNVAVRIALKARSIAQQRRTCERRAAEMTPTRGSEPEEAASEVLPILDHELGALPEKLRAPIVLCYLEGMTNEGAARSLGLPAGSMSRRLERGRDLLRERLTRRGVAVTGAFLGALLAEKAAFAAAVPPAVVASAAKVAVLAAAGEAAVSAPVALLVKGGLQALVAAKAKVVAAAAITVCLVGSAAGVATYRSFQPDVREDAAYSISDVARVDRRLAELAPSAAERRIDEIGWAPDLRTAKRLAKEHGRPVFLVEGDGDLFSGRFDGGAGGLRSGSLADGRVISLLNRSFVPVYLSNEDLEPSGGAHPEDRAEVTRIYHEALEKKMPAGMAAVYTVAPDGRVLGCLVVPRAHETAPMLALLEQACREAKDSQGAPLIKPALQSKPPPHSPGDLVLHVVARYVDASGAPERQRGSWHEVPAENWLVLESKTAAQLLPGGEVEPGSAWTLGPEIAKRILVHCYPATEDPIRDDSARSRIRGAVLRARVVSIRGKLVRARLEGAIHMSRLFNKTHPEHHMMPIDAAVSGYLDFEASGHILSLKLVTDQATCGGSPFAVAVQSH
jgi:RNA polymerase sigma factor (sigma-70 family)